MSIMMANRLAYVREPWPSNDSSRSWRKRTAATRCSAIGRAAARRGHTKQRPGVAAERREADYDEGDADADKH